MDSTQQTRAAWAAGAGLAAWSLVLLLTHDPPFIDLPQHAQNLAILRNPEVYSERYASQLSPFATNSLWFLVDRGLSALVSIPASLALAFFAAIVGVPAAAALWARELDRDPAVAWLFAWWAAWSGMVYWGFFHYSQAIAVGTLILAWDRAMQRDERGALRVGMAWVVLYMLHIQAWAWTAVLVAGQRAAHGIDRRRAGIGLGVWLPSALLASTWLARNLVRSEGPADMGTLEGGLGLSWRGPLRTLNQFVAEMSASFPFTIVDEVLGVGLLLAGLAGFVYSWRTNRDDRAALGALVTAVLTLAGLFLIPAQMRGQFFISNRLVAFLAPAAAVLAAVRLDRGRGPLLLFAGFGATLTLALNHASLRIFSAESRPAHALMSQIPGGQDVMLWPASRSSRAAIGGIYTHFTSWYATRSLGDTHFSFADFKPNPVVYRDHENTEHTHHGWENRPWCAAFHGQATTIDYVLTRGSSPGRDHCRAVALYADHLEQVASVEDWTLYRVNRPLPALATSCPCPGHEPRPSASAPSSATP